jgi:mannosyltransferase OCH1-like enzyme
MKGLSRFGSMFLLFLAFYQISLSTKCHLVVVQEQQAPPHNSISRASSRSSIGDEESSTGRRGRPIPSRRASAKIPLYDLVDTRVEVSCENQNLVLVNDTRYYPPPDHDNNNSQQRTGSRARRIPRIIHVTSKSRCLTRQFAENLELWKRTFPTYTFVLHNDEAMDRFLLLQQHKEFPYLSQIAAACLHTAAGKADLWRALILYEYGGIYTDIDNAPGKTLLNTTSIIFGHNDDNDDDEDENMNTMKNNNEAFFVVENEGMLSQYFMAAAPRHALLYLLIQTTLHRVQGVPSVEHQYVPFISGPGALKAAFVEFVQAQLDQPANNNNNNEQDTVQNANNTTTTTTNNNKTKKSKYDLYQKVRAGRYTGLSNWTVTVVGSTRTGSHEYVERNVIYQKRRVYQEMGMVHFSRIHSSQKQENGNGQDTNDPNESCMQRLYRLEQQQQQQQQEQKQQEEEAQ